MDDVAASQQLIDEGARVQLTPDRNKEARRSEDEEPTESHSPAQKKRKRRKPNESPSQQAASQITSPMKILPTLRSYGLADIQAYAENNEWPDASSGWPVSPLKTHAPDNTTPPNEIEVPDSQTGPKTAHTPPSPPNSSNMAFPASVPLTKRAYKKGKKRIKAEVDPKNILPDPEDMGRGEDTTIDPSHIITPSPSQSKRKRVKPSTASPSLLATEPENVAEEEDKPEKGMEPPSEPTTLEKKARKARKSRVINDSRIDARATVDDIVDSQSQTFEKDVQPLETPKPRPGSFTPEADLNNNSNNEDANRSEAEDDSQDGVASPAPGSREENLPSAHGQAPLTSTQISNPSVPPEASLDEDAIPPASSTDYQGSVKKRQYKKGRKPPRPSDNYRYVRKGPVDSMTAAERSLTTVRELHQPPDLRTGGDFTQDEEELLRRAIRDYQQRKGLEISELVEIIQWTDDTKDINVSRRKSDWAIQEAQEEQESSEFWEEVKSVNLNRTVAAIRSHVRSQYHAFKSGRWTKEEDEQLISLNELHPKRWKLISQIMGDRSMHDVHNRWRDYIQYGDSRKTSTWSPDEESLLIRAITTVAQRDEDFRAETGKSPLYEYTNRDINWMQVCAEMGNIRSRLQSSVKWTKMKARDPPPRILLEIKARRIRHSSDEDTQLAVEPTPRKRGRPRKSENAQVAGGGEGKVKKRRKSRKSESSTTGTASGVRMLWGDKFDLVEAIFNHETESEEKINWHDVASALNHPWPIQMLQSTQQELFEIVKNKGMVEDGASLEALLFAVLDFLDSEHGDDLGKRYDPHNEAGINGDTKSFDMETQEAGLDTLPNMKRKRRWGARMNLQNGRSASAKKRKTQSDTPTSYKSNYLVTESDDAESEPEA